MYLKKIKNFLFPTLAALAIIYAAAVPFTSYQSPVFEAEQIQGAIAQLPIELSTIPVLLADAKQFETEAVAVLAYDLGSKTVLYEKNAEEPWPTASLAKMMTSLVALNLLEMEDVIVVEESDTNVANPRMGLVVGEQVTVKTLLSGMIIASANDAAYALARGTTGSRQQFVGLMNALAERFGMRRSAFSDPAGFDGENQYSSPQDILTLTLEFLERAELSDISATKTLTVTSVDHVRTHWLETTNRLLAEDLAFGVKTGYTEAALGNLVALFEDPAGNKIVTVVMGSYERERDSKQLADWIFESYEFADPIVSRTLDYSTSFNKYGLIKYNSQN